MSTFINIIEDDFSLPIYSEIHMRDNVISLPRVVTPERQRETMWVYPNSPIATHGYRVVTPERPRRNNTDLSRNNVPRMFPNISGASGMVTPERPIMTDLSREVMPPVFRRSPRVVTPERRRLF